ncbi:unnamed protein product [Triticum aestivum]|uniref:Uncharacterized protein n=1 Tax=Triticum aestivum TaxID=4565 RepID=A0A7H4LLG1_WHEAT|nr:unnamed protein product [Triticum aestivum]
MRGMFWNSRGLGDLAKHKHISDCVRDHALDFVAISECGKRDFATRDLDHFSCGYDYEWHVLPPSRRSGGILLGIHSTYLELLSTSKGEYHIKFHLRNKADSFIWSLVAVYGAAQEEFKSAFLKELVNTCRENPHAMLVGGISISFGISRKRTMTDLILVGLFFSTLLSTTSICGSSVCLVAKTPGPITEQT